MLARAWTATLRAAHAKSRAILRFAASVMDGCSEEAAGRGCARARYVFVGAGPPGICMAYSAGPSAPLCSCWPPSGAVQLASHAAFPRLRRVPQAAISRWGKTAMRLHWAGCDWNDDRVVPSLCGGLMVAVAHRANLSAGKRPTPRAGCLVFWRNYDFATTLAGLESQSCTPCERQHKRSEYVRACPKAARHDDDTRLVQKTRSYSAGVAMPDWLQQPGDIGTRRRRPPHGAGEARDTRKPLTMGRAAECSRRALADALLRPGQRGDSCFCT